MCLAPTTEMYTSPQIIHVEHFVQKNVIPAKSLLKSETLLNSTKNLTTTDQQRRDLAARVEAARELYSSVEA